MTVPPTGTVTFLFTDVEGSTKQAQADAVAWAAAQARHHEIVQAAIEGNDGFVFKIVGDGFYAAFSKAHGAAAAAVAAQRGLHAEPWPGQELKARMGLHSGAAEWQNGDYEGYLTLAHAQRITSAAYGGQILVSQTAADLATNDLPSDLALRALGTHRLRDLPRVERIFQLVAPGLLVDFPALRSLDAFPNNLPTQLTSFIGREHELAELMPLLSAGRLLTLTGPGGTGKTRLALRLAADELETFADGAWLIELAPLTDPTLLMQTVAGALGIQEEQGRSPADVLTDYLRAKTLLLILDNCEHLIESCARLADTTLRAAPRLKILATSRETLGIAGETAFRVPSLPLPDPLEAEDFGRVAANDCVRLFVERASAADPRFHLTKKNAPAVAQICLRLDGIPLAIELAAPRIKVFSPDQIATRLDDRFRLLTGGSRTALERHQTLLALIDWSHGLLSDDERLVLRRLSVFAGGWSLEAAQAICADGAGDDVIDLLARLADKSLVTVDESADVAEARYRLLETIRQYARDKLLQSGESERIHDRHLAHYLGFAEEAEPRIRSAEQLQWLGRMETEHDNLRAALAWSLESADVERALRLAGAAAHFWELRGYGSEGHKWLDEALAQPLGRQRRAFIQARTAPRAKALYWAGRLLYAARGESVMSRELIEQSLRAWRELGDKWWMAVALQHDASMLLWEGDSQTARTRAEEGLSLARQLQDRWPLALCLISLSVVAAPTDLAEAHRLREEGVTIARSIGDKNMLSQGLIGLALLYVQERNLAAARPIAAEALTEARAIGTVTPQLVSLMTLAVITSLQGDQTAARGHCLDLFTFARQTGSSFGQFVGLLASGFVACSGGDAALGVRLLTAGETFAGERGVKVGGGGGMFSVFLGQAMATAEGRLDQATLEAAIQEGRTLKLEQAIELATEA